MGARFRLSRCRSTKATGASERVWGTNGTLAKTSMPFEGFKMVVRESMRDMPAYNEAVLADKDLVDIYAFLQSLPDRRPAKDIAILRD